MFDHFDRINLFRSDRHLSVNQDVVTVALFAEENSEQKNPETDIKDAAPYDTTQIDGSSKNEFTKNKPLC